MLTSHRIYVHLYDILFISFSYVKAFLAFFSVQHKFLLFERKDHEYLGAWEKGQMHGNGEYAFSKKNGKEIVTTTYSGSYYFGKKCG